MLAPFFKRTRAGKWMQATAEQPEGGHARRDPDQRIYMYTFAVGAAVAGAAGVLMAPLTLLYPDVGFVLFIKGFAAAVLGGLTSMPGAVLGGLRSGSPTTGSGYLHTASRTSSAFIVIMFALIFLPTGLLRRAGPAEGLKCAGSSVGNRRFLASSFGALALLPAFANQYIAVRRQLLLLYIILAFGLNILLGFAGQLAFANAAMFGIGAYGTALLQVQLGWSFWLARAGRRRAGHGHRHVARIPRAAAQRHLPGARDARVRASDAVGDVALAIGDLRRRRLSRPATRFRLDARQAGLRHLLLSLGCHGRVVLFTWNIMRSRIGRAFVAMRDGEIAAQSLGIDLSALQGDGLRAVRLLRRRGGRRSTPACSASSRRRASISSRWSSSKAMIVVGGLGSVVGAVFGAALLVYLMEVLREFKSPRRSCSGPC